MEEKDERKPEQKYFSQSQLKRLRTYAGLTQKELAEKSGVSQRMIEQYEQGRKDIEKCQARTLYDLSVALGCGMEDILIMQQEPGEPSDVPWKEAEGIDITGAGKKQTPPEVRVSPEPEADDRVLKIQGRKRRDVGHQGIVFFEP